MSQKLVIKKLLQSATEVYYKVHQLLPSVTDCYYKVWQTVITKCAKCDRYYKVRHNTVAFFVADFNKLSCEVDKCTFTVLY